MRACALKVIRSLVELFEASGKPDKAEEWRGRDLGEDG
jgi:hypothetical protein